MIAKRKNTVQVDNRGRVMLGKAFANRVVIVTELDETEVSVAIARVIPEREAWLYDNAEAKKAVFTGIEQARNGKLVDGPDLSASDDITSDDE